MEGGDDMSAEQERQNCRKAVEEAVSPFRKFTREPRYERLYLPTDFRDEQQEVMLIAVGTDGCKQFCRTVCNFWVYAFVGFLEVQMRDKQLECQARDALCEVVTQRTMRAQVRDCLSRLKPPLSPKFRLRGSLTAIYRMFNDDKRVSFAVETTQNYYAFFYERQTGHGIGTSVPLNIPSIETDISTHEIVTIVRQGRERRRHR
jgi:hypothetical protein